MAYDEISFLNGIALGRAMKGISMANPNRGDLLRVLSGRLAAARIIALRPEAVLGFSGDSAEVASFRADIHGQRIRTSAFAPAEAGIANLGAAVTFRREEERISASAAMPGELTDDFSASLRQKAPERSLRAAETPGGLGDPLLAEGRIDIEE